jgi:hypothetical protein
VALANPNVSVDGGASLTGSDETVERAGVAINRPQRFSREAKRRRIVLEYAAVERRVRIGELLVRVGQTHREGPVRAEQHALLPVHGGRQFERIGIVCDAVDAEALESQT